MVRTTAGAPRNFGWNIGLVETFPARCVSARGPIGPRQAPSPRDSSSEVDAGARPAPVVLGKSHRTHRRRPWALAGVRALRGEDRKHRSGKCDSDQARAEQDKTANGHSEETVGSEFFAHGAPPGMLVTVSTNACSCSNRTTVRSHSQKNSLPDAQFRTEVMISCNTRSKGIYQRAANVLPTQCRYRRFCRIFENSSCA
jgi:hypothetical protein